MSTDQSILWGNLGIVTVLALNILENIRRPQMQQVSMRSYFFWIPYFIYCFICVVLIYLINQDGGKQIKELVGLKDIPLSASFSYYIGISMPSIVKNLILMMAKG